jgi:catechol 2,3-dioxygenase-like lactoylglutathione lyase family enzyme
MHDQIQTGAVHHMTLTVSDVERARSFYTGLLGFQNVVDLGPRALLSNGSIILAIGPAPDAQRAIVGDRFDENRIGLDHVSFSVANRTELERAITVLDEEGVSHGEIKDLGQDFGMYVLAFRDPDNIQVELTALYG